MKAQRDDSGESLIANCLLFLLGMGITAGAIYLASWVQPDLIPAEYRLIVLILATPIGGLLMMKGRDIILDLLNGLLHFS